MKMGIWREEVKKCKKKYCELKKKKKKMKKLFLFQVRSKNGGKEGKHKEIIENFCFLFIYFYFY